MKKSSSIFCGTALFVCKEIRKFCEIPQEKASSVG